VLAEQIKQLGLTSQTPTIKEVAVLIQALEKKAAVLKGESTHSIKVDVHFASKVIKRENYNLRAPSVQSARRTYALADIRNSVAAVVMLIILFYHDPFTRTQPIPPQYAFNLDATVMLLMNGSAAAGQVDQEKLVQHPEVKTENSKKNRSTTKTKGKKSPKYYRVQLYLTTSGSGQVIMPVIVIKKQKVDKPLSFKV
jgi:hypothetical protein